MRELAVGRVSSKRQGREDRKSLPYQRQVIEEDARKNSAEIVGYLTFTESGHKSRWKDELEKIKDEAKRLQADVVVTSELDRLARRSHWQGAFVEDLDRVGIRYRAILDDLDTGREADRIKLLALGMVSEVFIMSLRRKVRGGMEMALADGKMYPRPAYGYRRILGADGKPDGRWEPDPERAPWVPLIFQWRSEHEGIPAITRRLKQMGATAPVNGRVWYEDTVRELLQRPCYMGTLEWGAIKNGPKRGKGKVVRVPDAVPVLVPPDLWEKVQQVNRIRFKARSRSESPYLLAGLVRSHCGCGMFGRKVGDVRADGTRLAQYVNFCHKWHDHPRNSINGDWLHKHVVATLAEFAQQASSLPAWVSIAAAPHALVEPIEQQVATNRSRAKRLLDNLIDDTITKAAYTEKLTELDAEHERLQESLKAALAPAPGPSAEVVAKRAAAMRKEYARLRKIDPVANPGPWKAYLQTHVKHIVIGPSAPSRRPEDRDIQIVLR